MLEIPATLAPAKSVAARAGSSLQAGVLDADFDATDDFWADNVRASAWFEHRVVVPEREGETRVREHGYSGNN